MLAFLAPALAFLKRLNLSQIALIAVLAFACVQTVRIEGFGIWPLKIHGLSDKYESALTKLNTARAELQRISTAKDEQRVETVKTITKADAGNKAADKVADKIEAAPMPGGCRTPGEILSADL